MSVSDVGQPGKTPEVSAVQETTKSQTKTILEGTTASAAARLPVRSEAATAVTQALENSFAALHSGRHTDTNRVAGQAEVSAGIIDEAILSGDVQALQATLQQATPASLAALAESLQAAGTAALSQEELVSQVQSLAARQFAQQGVSDLRDSLRALANELEAAIKGNTPVASEALLNARGAIQVATSAGSLSTSASKQLRTLGEVLRVTREGASTEQQSELLKSVNSALKMLESSSKEVQSELTRVLENSTGGTFKGDSLANVSSQVRDFLASVQSFDSLALAKTNIEKLVHSLPSGNDSQTVALRKLFEDVSRALSKTSAEGALDVSALKQLSASSIELSRATLQEPAVSDRTMQITMRELHAHLQNIALEQGAASKIQGTIEAALSSVDTPAIKESIESLGRTLQKVLSEVPAYAQGGESERARQVQQLIDSHLASATASLNSLNERVEEIFTADSIEQVLKTLASLRQSLENASGVEQQLVYSFASNASATLSEADAGEAGRLSLSMYVSLSQVKQDLLQLFETIAGSGSSLEQSQQLLEVLSQQQRGALRSLDGLLDTAIQEVRASIEQGGGLSSQTQLIDTLQALAVGLQQSGNAESKALAATVRELAQSLSKELGAKTPNAESVLQNLLTIKESIADISGALEKAVLLQQLATVQQQLDSVLNRGNPVPGSGSGRSQEIRELLQSIRSQLATDKLPLTADMQAALNELGTITASGSERPIPGNNLERLLAPLNEAAINNQELTEMLSSLTGMLQGATPTTAEEQSSSAPEMSSALQALESLLKSALPASSTETIAAEFQALLDIVTRIQTKGAAADSPFEQSLASVVKQLSGSLEQALHGGADKQQEVLVQFSELVRKEALKMLGQDESATRRAETIKNLKDLAALVKGQEALLSMAPLIEAAGDPVFLLFPAILEGFLSKIEMTYYGEQDAVDAEEQKQQGERKGFESTDISLELPGLGPVAVSFSHNGAEVLCTLQFEEQVVADFVEYRVPKLEAAFSRAGFSEFSCAVTVGKVESVAPEWVREFNRGGVIA